MIFGLLVIISIPFTIFFIFKANQAKKRAYIILKGEDTTNDEEIKSLIVSLQLNKVDRENIELIDRLTKYLVSQKLK